MSTPLGRPHFCLSVVGSWGMVFKTEPLIGNGSRECTNPCKCKSEGAEPPPNTVFCGVGRLFIAADPPKTYTASASLQSCHLAAVVLGVHPTAAWPVGCGDPAGLNIPNCQRTLGDHSPLWLPAEASALTAPTIRNVNVSTTAL